MGYAKIVGGGPDGRYTIEVDSGETERLALLARFAPIRIATEAELALAGAKLLTEEASTATKGAAATAASNDYIA